MSAVVDDGWSAVLNCNFEAGPDRSIVRRSHRGPLYMQRPFYPEGKTAHVYMLHPPGGVVAGDSLNINVTSDAGAQGFVSTPGATKFYLSQGKMARVNQNLSSRGGSLEWFPQENIFFANSRADLNTEIRLSSNDKFAWWEINCFGRQARNEDYQCGSIRSAVNLYIDDRLSLKELLIVDEQRPLTMVSGMRGNRVAGTLVLTPMREESAELARKLLAHDRCFYSTYFDSILVVRYLGDSSEDAKAGFSAVWSKFRLALTSNSAIVPRIWAT